MAEVINLRKARKRREREIEAAKAAENRVRHGRSKARKQIDKAAAAHTDQSLDGARLQD